MTVRFRPRLFSADVVARDDGTPQLKVSLRWRVHPALGLPREPFKVFRRKRGTVASSPLFPTSTSLDVQGRRVIAWDGEPQMELAFSVVRPSAQQPMTFQALDDRGNPIAGTKVGPEASLSFTVVLRHPNMCELLVTGQGTVNNPFAVPMSRLMDTPGWELIELVGLPFPDDPSLSPAYDAGRNQGSATGKTNGRTAAFNRLFTALSQYQPPPTSNPATGRQAPAWPKPASADAILAEMTNGDTSPLGLIRRMLVDTSPKSPYGNHALYRRTVQADGFRQPGDTTGRPKPASLDLGVMGLTTAAVTTDLWAALALGFGTTLTASKVTPPPPPPRVAPEPEGIGSPVRVAAAATTRGIAPADPGPEFEFDYMITADYRNADGMIETRGAVAGLVRTPIVLPGVLSASILRRHRPMALDAASSVDVRLAWRRLSAKHLPHVYAIGFREGDRTSVVLNQKRASGGFSPYVPVHGLEGDDGKVTFVDAARPSPLTTDRQDVYMAAATDVFGRWSAWAEASAAVAKDPVPEPPRLLKCEFVLGSPLQGVRGVHASLILEWALDWNDRRWQGMAFVGGFYPPAGDPPSTPPTGFVDKQNPTAPMAAQTIEFNPFDGAPQKATPGVTAKEILPRSTKEDGVTEDGIRRYRMTFPFFDLDFSKDKKLAFAVYAKANTVVDPARFTVLSDPASARANDPLPVEPPKLPPEILWTALPDATGLGRARLSFPAVPGAAGYSFYQATETALRAAAGLGPAAPRTDILARALVLKGTPDKPGIAASMGAQDAYARVNTELLPSPEAELALPASADGLFAFVVASTTAGQVESARSGVMLAGVPRRLVPGAPGLRLAAKPDGVHVAVVPAAGGTPTAAVALHRAQSATLAADPDLMGPPVVARGAAAWKGGTPQDPAFRLVDPVEPSWRPYIYRAVAHGPEDALRGKRSGRSAFSQALEVLVPPATAPDLGDLDYRRATLNKALLRIRVRSGAETRPSPLGAHRIQFIGVDGAKPAAAEVVFAEAPLGEAKPVPNPPVEALGQVHRVSVDAAGRHLYEAYVPATVRDVRVRLLDPLGRATTLSSLPDLEALQVATSARLMKIAVGSAAPVTPPANGGAFVLSVSRAGGPKPVLLAQAALDKIAGGGVGSGGFARSGPDADGRFLYTRAFDSDPGPAALVVALVEPLGLFGSFLGASVDVPATGGEES